MEDCRCRNRCSVTVGRIINLSWDESRTTEGLLKNKNSLELFNKLFLQVIGQLMLMHKKTLLLFNISNLQVNIKNT